MCPTEVELPGESLFLSTVTAGFRSDIRENQQEGRGMEVQIVQKDRGHMRQRHLRGTASRVQGTDQMSDMQKPDGMWRERG